MLHLSGLSSVDVLVRSMGLVIPRAGTAFVIALAVACTSFGVCAQNMPETASSGFSLSGEKSLTVVTRDGQTQRIGSVTFEGMPDGLTHFAVKMDTAVLRDFFLSMREFKCLPAEAEVTCVVPYPYAQPGIISPGNLTWLEHSLLFLYKQPRDFGAKLWNGMIFQLKPTASGFVGKPQAVDLNTISAPPEDLGKPPYGPLDRSDFAPGERWVTELRIE